MFHHHHHPFRSFHLEEMIAMVDDNHLPLKKRIHMLKPPHQHSSFDPYYHPTMEYRLTAEPGLPVTTTTSRTMITNGTTTTSTTCSETCSVDSGFSECEPLDLSFHSNESLVEEEDFRATPPPRQPSVLAVQPSPPLSIECSASSSPSSSSSSSSSLVCPNCNKIYESQARYRAHIRRHESKQSGRYQCQTCRKNFVQRSSLRTHERIHSGEKPYHCLVCHERFGDFSTFTKHRRTHTGEKPYRCPVCSRSFSQSGNMHRHLKVVHKPRPNLLYSHLQPQPHQQHRQWEQPQPQQ